MASTVALETGWEIANASESVRVQARAPFVAHTALQDAGHIAAPYDKNHDSTLRWIVWDEWTARVAQHVGSEAAHSRVYLDFAGLDSITDVSFNGTHVARTENQHRRYLFDVSRLAKPEQDNEIKVVFHSAPAHAKHLAEQSAYPVPDGFGDFEARQQNGERYRNYVRKAQCSFSWDWGPCFAPVGVWRPAHLHILPPGSAIVKQVIPQITLKDQKWTINVCVHLVCHALTSGRLTLKLLKHTEQADVRNFDGDDCRVTITLAIPERDQGQGDCQTVWEKNVGFRTSALVQEQYKDRKGQSFYFVINGKRIFAKGSNLIPLDAFSDKVTYERLKNLVTSAKAANMNMLRIWGGGQYMEEDFYRLADEQGIMIWQEFMFACAMYPGTKVFLDNVKEEVAYQAARLSYHPSVVLWSGNNENQEALVNKIFPGTGDNPHLYTVDYHSLFNQVIPEALARVDTTRPYIGSSPSNGVIPAVHPVEHRFLDLPYLDQWIPPQGTTSDDWGDKHYYNYGADGLDWTQYPSPRMATEYGWMSMPSFSAWRRIGGDLNPLSDFTQQRNHHRNGQQEMIQQIHRHFKFPQITAETECTEEMTASICYLTQVMQALIIRSQTDHYRRQRFTSADCMGALYWQLNDIWPAPTWSSTEYFGKWKLLHYFIKDAFAPLHLSAIKRDQSFEVHLENEHDKPFGGTLKVGVYDAAAASLSPTQEHVVNVCMPPCSGGRVYTRALGNLKTTDFLRVSIGDQVELSNFFCPHSWTDIMGTLRDPQFELKVDRHDGSDSDLRVTVTCRSLAFFVQLELDENKLAEQGVAGVVQVNGAVGRFDSNGFDLLPSNPRVVQFSPFGEYGFGGITAAQLQASIRARSLWDICHDLLGLRVD
ncbi:hypothetical protein RI367_002732 [Sorochytrium milnesiophthora]